MAIVPPPEFTYALVFDTETTGLSFLRDRIMQIAWRIVDRFGGTHETHTFFIHPGAHDFVPHPKALAVHGITNEICTTHGQSLAATLRLFMEHCQRVQLLVGHNAAFDIQFVRQEARRCGIDPSSMEQTPIYCTMRNTQAWCALPNNKFPRLEELFSILFRRPMVGAHDAGIDVECTAMCFHEIMRTLLLDEHQEKNAAEPVIPLHPECRAESLASTTPTPTDMATGTGETTRV